MDKKKIKLRLNPLASALLLAISSGSYAADYYFPRGLISDSDNIADITVFEKEQGQLPGVYPVDITLNGAALPLQNVRFIAPTPGTSSPAGLQACLSQKWYIDNGVRIGTDKSKTASDKQGETDCFDLKSLIPESSEHLDFQNMKLNINVPQAYMNNVARDTVPPERWDEGVNALLLNYRFNGDRSRRYSQNSTSNYLSLESGINVGPWRLRDNSVYTRYSGSNSRSDWKHIKTYASRTIVPWRGELTLGDHATTGDIFDSIDFRGAMLASDEDMYPDSLRGFAPVIRGIALSNARVTIRQSGYVIYQTYVSPGPFEIRDLSSMASSGDLTVEVTEADGQVRRSIVPYSSVPVLQRPGHHRYSIIAGKYRSGGGDDKEPTFLEGTYIRGFENNATAYGGIQAGERYHAASLGAGINLGRLGAVSADITQANSELADGSHHQGQSLRFLYAHSFNSLGTTFQLMGYRYSTKGFYTLQESARKSMTGRIGPRPDYNANLKEDTRPSYNLNNSKRQRFVANISQSIGTVGSVYLTGTYQSYWNTDQTRQSWQSGFSSSLWGASYNVAWGYTKEPGVKGSDKTLSLSLSVPLSLLFRSSSSHSMYATTNYTRNGSGNSQIQAGVSGTALERDNLNWSVQQGQSRSQGDKENSGSVNLNYQGTYGNVATGYNYGKHDRQVNYGLSGGISVHGEGVTLSQPLGETNILVAAPGAPGVALDNQTGVSTDWRGYTVVPYATVYRENRVSLNMLSLDDRTELDTSVAQVVPTRGALVKAGFKARSGYRAMFTLVRNGKPLPFGSMVSVGDSSGIVGDDGQVYMSGLEDSGELKASWGADKDDRCRLNYAFNKEQKNAPLITVTGQCI
ncbi:fimbria/pilus outer membrane usher protein [Pluralibacter gergoviae]|uniref:fimbria/pilus outer membrane usher protein n=1 Tax=Pluralibacter gergoviae TaxID=61647 RepID=UPI003EE0285B